MRKELNEHIAGWLADSSDGPYNYRVISTVFRMAGTGSLGVKRYLFLLKSTNKADSYLLLDMKQSRASSVLPYINVQQLHWLNDAERIIAIQKRMQYVPAALLSATVFKDEAFVIQELQPVKDGIKFKLLADDYRGMYEVIDAMGQLTASAQLRSGGMQGSGTIDELSAFGNDTGWQQHLLGYAKGYADKVKHDFQVFRDEFKAGRLNSSLASSLK